MRSSRRQLLDEFLTEVSPKITGDVLDIGGKNNDRRGHFRPDFEKVNQWLCLNIDVECAPDILASAEKIPLPDQSVDVFLMCEVIEHLSEPELCLSEASRILKSGGYGIITIPFLFPIHADPDDYQRWTVTRIKKELSGVGLEVELLRPMGGVFAVIMDIIQIRLGELRENPLFPSRLAFGLLALIKRTFVGSMRKEHAKITTGFRIIARKP